MVSILDIGPLTENVTIVDRAVPVGGVSAQALFGLLLAFPQLRKVLADKKLDGDMVTELVAQAPETIAEIIAAGLISGGAQEDGKALAAWARGRGVGEQYDLVAAILRMTFPQGLQSFLDALEKAMASVAGRGWGQATKSDALSKPA